MTSLTLQFKPQSKRNLVQEEMCVAAQSCPSMCRCCQFYQFQGRSSGYCHKLGVSVSSQWRSCPFAMSPFTASWEGVKEILP